MVSLYVQTTICQPINNLHGKPVDQRQLSDLQLNITFAVITPSVFNTEFWYCEHLPWTCYGLASCHCSSTCTCV